MSDDVEMVDRVLVCLICGDLMNAPNEKQLKIFGHPKCCETMDMVPMDRNHLFKIVKGLDNLKAKLEDEILRGMV